MERDIKTIYNSLNSIGQEANIDFGLGKYDQNSFAQKYGNEQGVRQLHKTLKQISDEENVDFGLPDSEDEWVKSFNFTPAPDSNLHAGSIQAPTYLPSGNAEGTEGDAGGTVVATATSDDSVYKTNKNAETARENQNELFNKLGLKLGYVSRNDFKNDLYLLSQIDADPTLAQKMNMDENEVARLNNLYEEYKKNSGNDISRAEFVASFEPSMHRNLNEKEFGELQNEKLKSMVDNEMQLQLFGPDGEKVNVLLGDYLNNPEAFLNKYAGYTLKTNDGKQPIEGLQDGKIQLPEIDEQKMDSAMRFAKDLHQSEQTVTNEQANDVEERLNEAWKEAVNNEIGRSAWSMMSDEDQQSMTQRINEQRPDLAAANDYMTEAKKTIAESIAEAKGQNGAVSAGKGFVGAVFDPGTWDYGISELRNNLGLVKVINKIDSNQPLTNDEQLLIDAYITNMAAQAYFETGGWYKAGITSAQSIPFMLEMMLNPASKAGTGLMNKVVRYGLKRFAQKGGGKAITRMMEKYGAAEAEKALMRSMTGGQKIGWNAMKGASHVAGDILGSAAMTSTTGQVRTLADAVARNMGNVKFSFTPDGKIVYDHVERNANINDFMDAYKKAFTANSIENFSEMAGEYFGIMGKVFGFIPKKIGHALKGKMGMKKAVGFIQKVKNNDFVQWMNGMEKQAQWHGAGGEWSEEIVGGVMNALLVGDQTLDTDEDTGVFNKDNLIETAQSIGLMTGAMSLIKTGGFVYLNNKLREAKKSAEGALYDNPAWGHMRLLKVEGVDDVKQLFHAYQDIKNDDKLSKDQKQAALNYVMAQASMVGARLRSDAEDNSDLQSETQQAPTSLPSGDAEGTVEQAPASLPSGDTEGTVTETEGTVADASKMRKENARAVIEGGDLSMVTQVNDELQLASIRADRKLGRELMNQLVTAMQEGRADEFIAQSGMTEEQKYVAQKFVEADKDSDALHDAYLDSKATPVEQIEEQVQMTLGQDGNQTMITAQGIQGFLLSGDPSKENGVITMRVKETDGDGNTTWRVIPNIGTSRIESIGESRTKDAVINQILETERQKNHEDYLKITNGELTPGQKVFVPLGNAEGTEADAEGTTLTIEQDLGNGTVEVDNNGTKEYWSKDVLQGIINENKRKEYESLADAEEETAQQKEKQNEPNMGRVVMNGFESDWSNPKTDTAMAVQHFQQEKNRADVIKNINGSKKDLEERENGILERIENINEWKKNNGDVASEEQLKAKDDALQKAEEELADVRARRSKWNDILNGFMTAEERDAQARERASIWRKRMNGNDSSLQSETQQTPTTLPSGNTEGTVMDASKMSAAELHDERVRVNDGIAELEDQDRKASRKLDSWANGMIDLSERELDSMVADQKNRNRELQRLYNRSKELKAEVDRRDKGRKRTTTPGGHTVLGVEMLPEKAQSLIINIADKLNLDIDIETDAEYNGLFENGKIRIVASAMLARDLTEDEQVAAAFGHELTHYLKTKAPEKYKELLNSVKEAMGRRFNGEIETKRNMYADEIDGMSERDKYDYLAEEVVCDYCGKMLCDNGYRNRAVGNLQEKKPLARRIWDGLKNITNEFADTLGSEYGDSMRDCRDTFVEMLKAVKNDSSLQAETQQAPTSLPSGDTEGTVTETEGTVDDAEGTVTETEGTVDENTSARNEEAVGFDNPVAEEYLFEGGTDVIVGTDYLLKAIGFEFEFARDAIRGLADEWREKRGTELQDLKTLMNNPKEWAKFKQDVVDAIEENYAGDTKAVELIDNVLNHATGYVPKEGKAIRKQIEQLNNGVNKFSKREGEVEKTLMGAHNISEDKLRKVIKNGGFANPSVAVFDTINGMHTDYGDITLIPSSLLLEKSRGRNAGTWMADAWTPTYPQVSMIPGKGTEKVLKQIVKEWSANEPDEAIRNELDRKLRYFVSANDRGHNEHLQYQFLKEKGMQPEVFERTNEYDNDFYAFLKNLSEETGVPITELVFSKHGEKVGEYYGRKESEKWINKLDAELEKNGNPTLTEEERQEILNEYISKWKDSKGALDNKVYDIYKKAQRPERETDVNKTFSEAEFMVSKSSELRKEYEKWLSDLDERLGMEEKLFAGFTPSGNRRYVTNTVENASRLMNKGGQAGNTGWGGIGPFIAKISEQANTLDKMRKNKGKLIGKDKESQHEEAKQHIKDEFFELSQVLNQGYSSWEDVGDARMNEIAGMKGDIRGYLKREYDVEVSDEWMQRYNDLVNFIRNEYPVFYFETKFNRPVELWEFGNAVVPKGTSDDVVEGLKKAGVQITFYDKDVEGDRERVVNEVANNTNGVKFSLRNGKYDAENPDIRKSERDAFGKMLDEAKRRSGIGGQKLSKRIESIDPFYSNAAKAVESIKQEKATPEQWLAMITKNGGLKAGEDKWMGLSDWLKNAQRRNAENGGKATLTKQEVMDFIEQNTIEIEEVNYVEELPKNQELRDKINALWEEAEGNNYDKADWVTEQLVEDYGEDLIIAGSVWYDGQFHVDNQEAYEILFGANGREIASTRLDYTTEGLENKKEIALVVPTIEPYHESDKVHFGDAGEGRAVVWVRFGDATDADGKRVLVIDEVQSKRHQDGRENGYRSNDNAKRVSAAEKAVEDFDAYLENKYGEWKVTTQEEQDKYQALQDELENARYNVENGISNTSRNAVPDAPFDKNWHELAMKRMLRYAAENGYDKVAWTTGKQQAERYGLSSVVYKVTKDSFDTDEEHTMFVLDFTNETQETLIVDNATGKITKGLGEGNSLFDLVGKSVAEKMMELPEDKPSKVGSFELGGEGMKGFYDKMIPSFMNKYGKKWGAKVGEVELELPNEADRKMWSVDVTPEMKESVMQGQPLFSKRIEESMGITDEYRGRVNTGSYTGKDGKSTAYVQLSFDFGEDPSEESAGTVAKTPDEFRLKPLKEGETCLVERRYEESKMFTFTGKEKIESPDDVAYIFRSLEDSAIEHTFIVLIKDGKPTIIHTGMGQIDTANCDALAPKLAIDNIQPDQIIMVHNHPSGSLTPSRADKQLHGTLYNMYGDKLKNSIIIDQKSGKYAEFNIDFSDSNNVMPKKAENESEYKVYSFSKNVFSPDYSFEGETLTYYDEVAAFVSSHRLGDRGKLGVLICSNRMAVNGNILLDANEITNDNYVRIAKDIVSSASAMSGKVLYLHGSGGMEVYVLNKLGNAVKKLSGNQLHLMDAIKMEGNNLHTAESVLYAGEEGAKLSKQDGYDGKEYAYKNTKNNRKLFAPTYDDNGNLIPLSQRFNSRKSDDRYSKREEMIHSENFKNWFGDWEKAKRIEKLRKSKSLDFGDGNKYKGRYELNNKSASQYILDNLRGSYINKDTNEKIKISRKGAEKVTRHDAESDVHLKTIAYIPEMIENSIFITELKNEKNQNEFDSYRYYVVGLNIEGVDYTAKLVIGVKNGETYYDHSLTQIEKSALLDGIGSLTGLLADKKNAFGYKDKRLISILQNNSSKVVDEDGKPLVVHHGTQAYGFTVFDTYLTRGKEKDNVGSHFGDSGTAKDFADEDKTYNVYLNIKKPWTAPFDFFADTWNNAYLDVLDELRREIGTKEADKLFDKVKAIYPHVPADLWRSARMEGYNTTFDDDEGLESGHGNDFMRHRNDIVAIMKEMLDLGGYDGIKYYNWYEGEGKQPCWVALDPRQIKSADTEGEMANNGDFDPENPDIRYSKRTNPEPKKVKYGYKAFKLKYDRKDGEWKLYPPQIEKGTATPFDAGYLDADAAPIVAQSKTGRGKTKEGLSYRPGWHLGYAPFASQFLKKNGGKQGDIVFALVEFDATNDYQTESDEFSKNKNGVWTENLGGVPYIPENGYYNYRTNKIDPNSKPWAISSAMKVLKVLSRDEENAIMARQTPGRYEAWTEKIDDDILTPEILDNLNGRITNDDTDLDAIMQLKEEDLQKAEKTNDTEYDSSKHYPTMNEPLKVRSKEDAERMMNTVNRLSNEKFSKRVFGGNSGYVGYSKSVRAVGAEGRGLRSLSNIDEEFMDTVNDIISKYDMSPVTKKAVKDAVKRGVSPAEWHHTSMYGNRTNYYDPHDVAKYLIGQDEKASVLYEKEQKLEYEYFRFSLEKKDANNEVLDRYRKYVDSARRQQKEVTLSNGDIAKFVDGDWTFYNGSERLTKRNGKERRNSDREELAKIKTEMSFEEWAEVNGESLTEIPSYEEWLESREDDKPTGLSRFSKRTYRNIPGIKSKMDADEHQFSNAEMKIFIDDNNIFNEELSKFGIEGGLTDNHIFQLGKTGSLLQRIGFPYLDIEMSGSVIGAKAQEGYKNDHPFDKSEVADLVFAINSPLAVFNSSTEGDNSKVLLLNIRHNEHNFVAAVKVDSPKKWTKIKVNDIRGLYPKDKEQGIVDWINNGKLIYANKKEILSWMIRQQSNPAEATKPTKDFDVKLHQKNLLNVDLAIENVKKHQNKYVFEQNDPKLLETIANQRRLSRRVLPPMPERRPNESLASFYTRKKIFRDLFYEEYIHALKDEIDDISDQLQQMEQEGKDDTQDYHELKAKMQNLSEEYGENLKELPQEPERRPNEPLNKYYSRTNSWNTLNKHANSAKEFLGNRTWDDFMHDAWINYMDALDKWKEANGIDQSAEAPSEEMPVASADETRLQYASRVAKWRKDSAIWKHAPKLEDFEEEQEDEFYAIINTRDAQLHPNSIGTTFAVARAGLSDIRRAMRRQGFADKEAVDAVKKFAQDMLANSYVQAVNRGTVRQLLSAMSSAVGTKNMHENVNRVLEILLDDIRRAASNQFVKLATIKAVRTAVDGIQKQGRLALNGQEVMKTFRKYAFDADIEGKQVAIEKAIQELENQIDIIDSESWANQYAGLMLARDYANTVLSSQKDRKDIDEDYKKNIKNAKQLGLSYEVINAYTIAHQEQVIENTEAQVEAYNQMVEKLQNMISKSAEEAHDFIEREKQRIAHIHRIADNDTERMSSNIHHVDDETKAIDNKWTNNGLLRFFLQPVVTFHEMLKGFNRFAPNGEGYLYRHFMKKWQESAEKEREGKREILKKMDAKVQEIFGKKSMHWSDLYSMETKMPKLTVTIYDKEGERDIKLTQGNLLYIVLINDMTDGRVKLENMGIDELTVTKLKEQLDPRVLELGMWMRDELLPSTIDKYDKTHKRVFGAGMERVANYFPLKIAEGAIQKDEDVNMANQDALPSTSTNAIIKRTKNSLAIDVINADAFSILADHIDRMEEWNSWVEFRMDINALLSYKNFKNKLLNNSSILYGAGSVYWENFRNVCRIASGVYRPIVKKGSTDKLVSNLAKGVTGAKISFRVFTAMKQLLSAPAFLQVARVDDLAYAMLDPKGSWEWAIENLPLLKDRWEIRQVGDTRLMDNATDWKIWHTQTMEKLSRWGITPNAFVDMVTCSCGAYATYKSVYREELKKGFSEAEARKRALAKADEAYNSSQQSSENAYVAAIQLDRTTAANTLTVFRNSPFSYGRHAYDAMRQLRNMAQKDYKKKFLAEATNMYIEDGLTELQASAAAKREYKKAAMRQISRVALYSFVVTGAWNIGPGLMYMLFGDDDDKKKELALNALIKGMLGGPIEGLTGGNAISDMIGAVVTTEGIQWNNVGEFEVPQLPLVTDIGRLTQHWSNDTSAGVNDLINIAVQSMTGTNPQTLEDIVVAAIDYSKGDWKSAKEIAILFCRVINAPASAVDQMYIDELGMFAGEAQKLTYEQMAQRYAEYKMMKNNPIGAIFYNDEQRNKKIKTYIKTLDNKVQERMDLKDEMKKREILSQTTDISGRKQVIKNLTKEKLQDGETMPYDSNQEYNRLITYTDLMEDIQLRRKMAPLNKKHKEYEDLKTNREGMAEWLKKNASSLREYERMSKLKRRLDELKRKLRISASDKEELMKQIRSIRKDMLF